MRSQSGAHERASLLTLPPELRNSIYRYVLVPRGSFMITKDNYMQPPLLRTCRQLRQEASGIYYEENYFKIDCRDFDFTADLGFALHARVAIARGQTVAGRLLVSRTNASWQGLLRYLKAINEGRGIRLRFNPKDDALLNAICGASDMAYCLRDVEWTKVRKALEIYKKAVINCRHGEWDWHD